MIKKLDVINKKNNHMAHNAKLNVYKLILKYKGDVAKTYRDLIKENCNLPESSSDNDVFIAFFSHFINTIGGSNYRVDDKNKKVIGTISSNNTANSNITVRPDISNCIIDGVIEGGRFGIKRELAKNAQNGNKNDKTDIVPENAAIDKYYILLNTPLNSKIGYLMIQSYTEESIQDAVKSFITDLLSSSQFHKINIETYVPKSYIQSYLEGTTVDAFGFTSSIDLSDILRDLVQTSSCKFQVEIKIKPTNGDITPESEETDQIASEISNLNFAGCPLNNYSQKTYISDHKKHKANYDIERGVRNIRPTIYLETVGISCDKENGLPDFLLVKEYSRKILKEIIDDEEIKIDEL